MRWKKTHGIITHKSILFTFQQQKNCTQFFNRTKHWILRDTTGAVKLNWVTDRQYHTWDVHSSALFWQNQQISCSRCSGSNTTIKASTENILPKHYNQVESTVLSIFGWKEVLNGFLAIAIWPLLFQFIDFLFDIVSCETFIFIANKGRWINLRYCQQCFENLYGNDGQIVIGISNTQKPNINV